MTPIQHALHMLRARENLRERMWSALAYAARYGKQPLSTILDMTLEDLETFVRAIDRIVQEENKPRER